jgi:sterol desaturase/sphingolipid hydroxylase (fatty acid hydroxylase superfamily)
VPEIRSAIDVSLVRISLHFVLILGFILATVSLILRQNKLLGFTALLLILVAVALGGSNARISGELTSGIYFGLDWFILNLTLTGIVFLPLERLFRRNNQSVFRHEWREDLLYFLISSVMVQSFTYLSFAPSTLILAHSQLASIQAVIVSQPLWLQFFEIMFLTDLVQYWIHRLFHRVPWLWKFHAVHHSARSLDWLAGSRMHVVEIICLRGLTVIPMTVLGFEQSMIYLYLIVVYLYATYIHSNIRFDIEWLKPIIVTPRFHHWHHGIDKAAIDVNFSIHFPLFDRLFGTYYMPKGQWPSGYGVGGHPVPSGYWRQFVYPFTKSKP